MSYGCIAKKIKVPKSTLINVWKKYLKSRSTDDKSRTSRPSSTTPRQDRVLIRMSPTGQVFNEPQLSPGQHGRRLVIFLSPQALLSIEWHQQVLMAALPNENHYCIYVYGIFNFIAVLAVTYRHCKSLILLFSYLWIDHYYYLVTVIITAITMLMCNITHVLMTFQIQ